MSLRKVWRSVAIFTGLSLFAAGDSLNAQTPVQSGVVLTTTNSAALPPGMLTTAEQVHRLTREEAARAIPVRIQGIVTCSLANLNAVVIQDETRGIYVDHLDAGGGKPIESGDLLEVEGVTDPGEFAPNVNARRLSRLGKSPLPQPVHPAWDQLINGSLDTQYVEIQGIVTSVERDGVKLLTHSGKLAVALPGMDADVWKRHENSMIAIRGCLFASWDAKTHQVRVGQVCLYSPDVEVKEPAPKDLFAAPAKRVAELLQFDSQASALRRVKVSGQIVHVSEDEYFLLDDASGLRFVPREPVALQAGDLVEVAGFPSLSGPSPVLQEAVVRKTGSAPLGQPRMVTSENLFRSEYDSTLVRVRALLLRMTSTENGQVLELQTGLPRFVAKLARRYGPLRPMPPGSELELTGVYAGRGGSRASGHDPESVELLLNSASGVHVLSRPSWWTFRRVLWTLGGVSFVSLAAVAWGLTLRHRVRVQTELLRLKVQREILFEERTRIAREFHDTLEQALAGIGMQLEAATNRLSAAEDSRDSLQILNIARSMVRHSQEEARRSVWNLRTYALEQADLPAALAEMKTGVKNGSPVTISVEVGGSPRPLPNRVEGHLLRIGQEATTNAVKHAHCKNIRLSLRYSPQLVELSITDDGIGFDTQDATTSAAGHFGLLGMLERAEKAGGTLAIRSRPEAGTSVTVTVPLPENGASSAPLS